ncbi:hypothetical protein MMC14_003836 [Varicellaria rhodocarpa]|nr:hypothetical protein [Varicellaria rhodocarpa]
MRSRVWSSLVILLQSSILQTSATPVTAPFCTHPRSIPLCANIPNTPAGSTPPSSHLNPSARPMTRNPPPSSHPILDPFSVSLDPIYWCTPHFPATYIIIQWGREISGDGIPFLLQQAAARVQDSINHFGNFQTVEGVFLSTTTSYALQIRGNARVVGVQRLRYQMLQTVLGLLWDFMSTNDFGTGTFDIWDGGLLVGEGKVSVVDAR